MTEERRRELLAKDRRPIPSDGMLDAVSVPIEAEFGAAPYMTGKSSDWLYAVGSGMNRDGRDGAVPRRLSKSGWIYLRADERLVARVRFLGAELRGSRIEHIPSETGLHEDADPGLVLAVDPDTWEDVDIALDDPIVETGNGYRYYRLNADGTLTFTRVS